VAPERRTKRPRRYAACAMSWPSSTSRCSRARVKSGTESITSPWSTVPGSLYDRPRRAGMGAMARDDDVLDEEPRRLTHVIYNATLGHVRVRAEDGLATTIEVPGGEVRFRRVLGAVEPEGALWLDSVERDYLGRMLQHVLSTLRITPEARSALTGIQDKLTDLTPPAIGAASDAVTGGIASVPLVEAPPPQAPAVAAERPASKIAAEEPS